MWAQAAAAAGVRQLLRVLSPCCVLRSCCSCLASDIRMCRHMDVQKYSAQTAMSARCVPPRGVAQHQPRGCAAHSSSSVRTTRLITRLLLRFKLPGGYFGTTRLIIRLVVVVQLIIRLVVNYKLQADNPADNQQVNTKTHFAGHGASSKKGFSKKHSAREGLCFLCN